MSRLRVAAISYLNTAPLMWNFEHGSGREKLAESYDVHYTLPSQCARELAEGRADIGIIPVAAYTTTPGLLVIPEVAIATKRSVRSILLVSRKTVEQIRSVALDSSSRTSAALTKVLFAKYWRRQVSYAEAAPQLEAMLATNDAALLIGDAALKVDRAKYNTWDLAEVWHEVTGKPFVFAFWAVRSGAADGATLARVAADFQESKAEGLRHVEGIAQEWSQKLQLREGELREYLTRNIDYDLTTENIAGMTLYFRYATEIGALPAAPKLRFVATQRAALR